MRPAVWLGVLLFAAAALISGFTILRDIDPFDEGLMLQAARRVAAGQVPYRDFLWSYGPTEPYLLAWLIKTVGVSLLDWRILRMLADAGVALTAYLLVARRVPGPPALACWLAVATEMAEPRSANPFPFALLAVLAALLLADHRASTDAERIGCALLIALAASFRLDFGVYGAAALTAAIAQRAGRNPAARFVLYAALATALVYLPFAIADGPGPLYDALVGNSLHTGAYWSLPFPLHYHAPHGAGLAKTLKHGLDFYVPLLTVAGFALLVSTRDAGLITLGVGALVYLLSRTDEFHTQPLFVVVAIGLALTRANRTTAKAATTIASLLLALLLAHGVLNRLSAIHSPQPESKINVAAADGVQAPTPEARAIEQLVSIVHRLTKPHDPIYVLPRRSDLVRINDPLIYVLTGRANPTPEDFGLQAGAAAQREIVRRLTAAHVRVIVRWTDPLSSQAEPNLRGRATGVRILDYWVASHYRLSTRLYHYDVLTALG